MYKIYADDTLIYDSTFEEYKIAKGTITLETNKSGSFVFSIYPDHFYYDNFVKLKTVITVYKSGDILFRGRILNDVSDYWNDKVITCEGELGFLQDSIIRPFNFTGTPEELFTKLITEHNAQVDEFKRFKIGTVTVTDPNDYIARENADYNSALDNLNTRLLDGSLGGYFYVTHDNDDPIPTIHYLADFTNVSAQTVEFGANLKNYTKTVKADTLKTAIIPLGANANDKRLTITGVNNGKDYVYDEAGVSLYGWIFGVVLWDDVTNASNLKSKAEDYLHTIMTQNITIELNAIDLHLIDKSIDSFKLGDYIRVISRPHNFDSTLLCNRMTIDLLKPENDTLILGYTYATFTERNNKYSAAASSITQLKTTVNNLNTNVNNINNDVIIITEEIEKIKEGGADSPEIDQLYDDIEALAEAITQNAQGINTNKTAIAVNAQNIKSNDDDITDLQNDVSELQSDIIENTQDITDNADDIKQLQTDVGNLENAVQQNTTATNANTEAVEQLETDVETLENDVSQNTQYITALTESVNKNTSDITSLQQTTAQLDKDKESLTSAINQNAQNIADNATAIKANADKIDEIKNDIPAISTDTEALAEAITQNAQNINTLRNDINTNTANIKTNSDNIQANAEAIEALENTVNELAEGGSTPSSGYNFYTSDDVFTVPNNITAICISACAAGVGRYAGEYILNHVFNVTPGQLIEMTIGSGNTIIGDLITLIAGTVSSATPTTKLGYAAGYSGGNGGKSTSSTTEINGYAGYGGAFGFGGGGGGANKSGSTGYAGGGGGGIGGAGSAASTSVSGTGAGGGTTGGAGGRAASASQTNHANGGDATNGKLIYTGASNNGTSGGGGSIYGAGGGGGAQYNGYAGGGGAAGGYGAGGGTCGGDRSIIGQPSGGMVLIEWGGTIGE